MWIFGVRLRASHGIRGFSHQRSLGRPARCRARRVDRNRPISALRGGKYERVCVGFGWADEISHTRTLNTTIDI